MLRSTWKPLSATGLQLLLNQAMGLSVFLLLARQLSKTEFGLLNGLLAFLLLAFSILSFGIDQLLLRKVASGEKADVLLATGLLHNGLSAGLFYALLLLAALLVPSLPAPPLLLLAAGKSILYLGQIGKAIANGQERFRRLLFLSLSANTLKLAGLWVLQTMGMLTLPATLLLFAAADAVEGVICLLAYRSMLHSHLFREARRSYRPLLRAARPQLGTVIFAAALARFDWLYLAATCPAATLGEYSFAYKAFELAQWPLLAIAPLLVPRFTRSLQSGDGWNDLRRLARLELLLAFGTVVLLNGLWTPLAAWVSGGRYGAAEGRTVLLLSLSLPVLYYNNYLWSLLFAQGRTALIFRLFALTFGVNLGANLLLVPLWGKEGAAVAFGVALLLQTLLYRRFAAAAPNRSESPAEATAAATARIL